MWHRGNELGWLVSGLVLTLSAALSIAGPAGNPYTAIPARNVFGLRPSPPPPPGPPPAPLPKVVPVGITTILHDKRALLKVYFPAQPHEPAKEVSCVLRAGEREGPIEVLAINELEGSIAIDNSGTRMVLTLARDGPHMQTAAAPPVHWPRIQ